MKYTLLPIAALALITASCNKQEEQSASTPSSESAAKPYALDTCIVSGEKLGSMGKPIVINHEGQEIKFCCDSCVPKFKKDPAKYLSKLEHAGHNH
jgi:nitrous oxide reductase accessory protein NosL